jgi:hypothetical protein
LLEGDLASAGHFGERINDLGRDDRDLRPIFYQTLHLA